MKTGEKRISIAAIVFACISMIAILVTVDPIKNILLFTFLGIGTWNLVHSAPMGGYKYRYSFSNSLSVLSLCVILGVIFYFRWIPSGIIGRTASKIGVSSVALMIVLTIVFELPLLASLSILSQIIPQYLSMRDDVQLSNKRLQGLQVVRAFACMEIYFSHCLTASGATGVSLFFVLSGFLLTYNHIENDAVANLSTLDDRLKYAYSRVFKLYPLHIIMMLIALLIACLGGTSFWTMLPQLITQSALIQTWVPVEEIYYGLNGISWYLSTCLFAYFCFPEILRRIRRFKPWKECIWTSGIIYVLMLVFGLCIECLFKDNQRIQYYVTYVCPLFRVWDFVLGCNLGYVFLCCRNRIKIDRWIMTWLEIICVVLLWVTEYCYMHQMFPNWYQTSLLNLPVSLLTVFVFAISEGFLSEQLKNNRVVKWIAKNSPFFFLIHLLLLGEIRNVVNTAVNAEMIGKYLTAIITFAITMMLCEVYSKLYSRFSR